MTLYDQVVPSTQHYLRRTLGLINKALEHITLNSTNTHTFNALEQKMIQFKLVDNMYPCGQQANIAASFALRAIFPLTEIDMPTLSYEIDSFKQIQKYLLNCQSHISQITLEDFIYQNHSTIEFQAGERKHQLTAQHYVSQYATPNFVFHLTMFYALLKQCGVALGKNDFDGLHAFG